ncbi:hypothetical protein ACVSQB_38525 [Bradyrhizobium elkanii]
MAQTALTGALHAAGFELLVSARLAAAFADEYGASHGRLPTNLTAFWLYGVQGGGDGYWMMNPSRFVGERIDFASREVAGWGLRR